MDLLTSLFLFYYSSFIYLFFLVFLFRQSYSQLSFIIIILLFNIYLHSYKVLTLCLEYKKKGGGGGGKTHHHSNKKKSRLMKLVLKFYVFLEVNPLSFSFSFLYCGGTMNPQLTIQPSL